MSEIQALIDEIHHYVSESQQALANDLDESGAVHGMSTRVSELCGKLARFDKEEAAKHSDALQKALAEVQSLEEALRARQEVSLKALDGLKQHSAATQAYLKAYGQKKES